MRTDYLLVSNIRALLQARGQDQRDLAMWMGHHETWLSKILNESRGLRMKEIDRMADFFGLQGYQLLSPGIGSLTERRRGDRRSSRDRRGGQDRRRGKFEAPPVFRPKAVGAVMLAALLVGLPVRANEPAIYGQGNISCGTWRAERGNDAIHTTHLVWVLGFVSGAARNHEAPMRTMDAHGAEAFVDDYCAAQPVSLLADASQALVRSLRR